MKFSNKAGCKTAEQQDIEFAAAQNGLVAFEINGVTYGNGGIGRYMHERVATKPMLASSRGQSLIDLFLSFAFLVICFVFFVKATVRNVLLFRGQDLSNTRTERLIECPKPTVTTDENVNELRRATSGVSDVSSKSFRQARLVRAHSASGDDDNFSRTYDRVRSIC